MLLKGTPRTFAWEAKVPYDKQLTSGFDKETRWKVSEMVIVLCINRKPSLSRNKKK